MKTIILIIALSIATVGTVIALIAKVNNKNKTIAEMNERINQKRDYYKRKDVLENLVNKKEYTIKNNKIIFSDNFIKIQDTKNYTNPVSIGFNKIIDIEKEFTGKVYDEFTGDKLWDGYSIVITYSSENSILKKKICLRNSTNSMSDIVDSISLNTLSNIIIDKIEQKMNYRGN